MAISDRVLIRFWYS